MKVIFSIISLALFLVGCATTGKHSTEKRLAKVWDFMENDECEYDVIANRTQLAIGIYDLLSKTITPGFTSTSTNFYSTTYFYSDLPEYKELFPRVKKKLFLDEEGNHNIAVDENILKEIDIYENTPSGMTYKTLGEIYTVLKDNNLSASCINKYEIYRKLKETAHRVGANAVINVKYGETKKGFPILAQKEIYGLAVKIEGSRDTAKNKTTAEDYEKIKVELAKVEKMFEDELITNEERKKMRNKILGID